MRLMTKKDIICIISLFSMLLLPNICALFMAVDMQGSWVMKIGYMVMVGVCLLVPALIFKARTYFIIEGIFSFLFMPIDIASLYLNKQSASKLFLNSILNTDISEALEFLQSIWQVAVVVIALWGVYIYLCVQVPNEPLLPQKIRYWGAAATLAMTMVTYIALSMLVRKIHPNYTSMQIVTQTADRLALKFYKIYPYNLYIHARQLWLDQQAWNKAQTALSHYTFGISKRDSLDNTLYILYIGEAARYDHMGINSYERQTTPKLSSQKNIISYSSIYTQANLTNYSIPFILTRATAGTPEIMHREKSIVEAFQEAGYKTAFISKNSYTPFTMRIMNSCDYHYIFSRGMDAVESYDIDLIEQLKGITTSEGQFVVLHSLGSHFKYSLRYPADAAHFFPALAASDGYDKLTEEHKQLLVNAYDNSILYTDQVLGELIDWVEAQNKQAVIMYISDHGESFWDDERKLSLHGSYELSDAEYHVPCIIWYSDEYQIAFPHKVMALHQNKDVAHNSSVTFSTLLDIAGIDEAVDYSNSLCSPAIQAIDSFPVLNGAGATKTYVINH